jgi:hypothetical protein
MRTPNNGQSSHKPGDDRPIAPRQWLHVPVEIVREFVVDLCTVHKTRGVGRMVDLAPETVRKFALGMGVPNFATRRRFALLYLEMNAEGVVAEKDDTRRWKARRRLTQLLAEGEGPARAELAKIFELAKRFPGEVPPSVEAVEEWMDLQVRGEYWAEDYYGAIARGERSHDENSFLAQIPKRTQTRRKKGEASEAVAEEEPSGDGE